MADLPLWGSMQKAQDDPETIEEAIVRIVADHNDDPEGHLGEGRSLQSHKAEDVIDHPPGSIPFDKTSASELFFQDNFTGGVDQYDPEGHVTANGGILALNTFHGDEGYAGANVGVPWFQNATFPEKEIVVQFMLQMNWNTSADFISVCFGGIAPGIENGFGIYMDGNVVKFALWVDSTEYDSGSIAYTKNEVVSVRIHVDPGAGVAKFYIDGAVLFEVELPASVGADFGAMNLYIEDTVSTYASVGVALLRVAYTEDLV